MSIMATAPKAVSAFIDSENWRRRQFQLQHPHWE
jgi:hypothetical protein